jgi:hypothetical protein
MKHKRCGLCLYWSGSCHWMPPVVDSFTSKAVEHTQSYSKRRRYGADTIDTKTETEYTRKHVSVRPEVGANDIPCSNFVPADKREPEVLLLEAGVKLERQREHMCQFCKDVAHHKFRTNDEMLAAARSVIDASYVVEQNINFALCNQEI